MEKVEQQEEPLTVDQEYDLWKSNVPLLYDFVSETRLTWPSLTLQWLPGDKTSTRQHLILGTLTSGAETDYLKIAALDLPDEIIIGKKSDKVVKSNLKVVKKFAHDGEINRARYMPQNTNIIATVNGEGTIFIYDCSRDKQSALLSTLKYHKDNAYGLAFNPNAEGELISGSDDSTIALWDATNDKLKQPIQEWTTSHSDIVNDCQWHCFNTNMFGSVSEDSTLQLFDKRNGGKSDVKISSKGQYNSIAFSGFSENLFAAAGTTNNIYLYDIRNTGKILHSMTGHEEPVTSLEFSNDKDGILISGSSDRRVIMWDLFEIGAEQQPDEADDGLPEVMMIHAGSRSAINDISTHPSIPWLNASVEENNIVQVWKCSSKLPRISGTPEVSISDLE
ncbi:hypothetical protein TPHA_0M00190 [Tetrapisispora phaffii CBS 4417]|uniref:Histone-binding protein RBBP4-like N-terminal domain-containing protein n=1 Tax=Tetrapisispora phaffii (strain ATCC 24235 / CBS 4417 / NBRC 1672 / NRRL Y-8282 / UCD 70-5) TaxID=1071381 RepID=G8C0T6_TETPH|nr:hypothetical protein TPHA_0M00190 [Tetrapisispora phaffii CBS 4417]CCE65597.1 hypothetical protein TPHA_0M00190 [Tetrapisispora phaffii CBS 4417]